MHHGFIKCANAQYHPSTMTPREEDTVDKLSVMASRGIATVEDDCICVVVRNGAIPII